MSDSILKFCPKCCSLFNYTDIGDKLQLTCKNCGYTESEVDGRGAVINVKYVQETGSGKSIYALPRPETIHDQTMFRTTRIQCQNPECLSLDPINWKADGANLPVCYMFNQPEENRAMYIMCTACSSSWKINSK